MNKIILTGRLTAKPYQGFTASNIEYSRFTLACRRNYSDANNEPVLDFVPCVAWRQNAEFINKYLDKGSLILVEGAFQSSRVTNKDGAVLTSYTISVDRIESLETKTVTESRKKLNTQEFSIPTANDYSIQEPEAEKVTSNNNVEDDFADLEW
ncbi:single-stranded DNA-binding protein [Metamycoplasma buccale]|uniref:single-stranded DNA-binding protein n=1 Tax=Metamycoplasma buccale TaxID=55602 RepID=UPI00398E87E0